VPLACALAALCFSLASASSSAQLSDPMAPPGTLAAMPSDLAMRGGLRSAGPPDLQGIISGPGRRLALINGEIVQVGQTIPGNGELLNVGPDSATVRSDGKSQVLRLHPNVGKKEAPR